MAVCSVDLQDSLNFLSQILVLQICLIPIICSWGKVLPQKMVSWVMNGPRLCGYQDQDEFAPSWNY